MVSVGFHCFVGVAVEIFLGLQRSGVELSFEVFELGLFKTSLVQARIHPWLPLYKRAELL